MVSERFSALLSATKGMSADAADLFRESEADLQGDGIIVNSLSNLSVSDFMRSNTGDNLGTDPRLGHKPNSLSALLSGDQPLVDMGLEGGVQVVLASDFQGCGFPALDASLNLLGFYHLLTETVGWKDPIQSAVYCGESDATCRVCVDRVTALQNYASRQTCFHCRTRCCAS